MTDGVALSRSILDSVPLNDTAFESSVSLLPWVWTCIGVNNIEPLTPDGWFEEVHGFKGGKNNNNVICMPFHYKDNVLWAPAPSVVDLVLIQLGEAVQKRPNSLHVFICTKLMIPLWGRLMFKMADLVVYGPPGGGGGVAILNARAVCSWFYFPPHTTHALAAQGGTQGFGTWKDGVIRATVYSRGTQVVFCANSRYSQRGWPPCQECWHGDFLSAKPDREPYDYGIMEDVEGIAWNCNPKGELIYKHLTNGVQLFIPFLGPKCHF